MKFSVDRESVSDIISALTSYSDDIDSEFRKFEDEIKKIAIKTNYNKLLYALQGIIDIYNDVICGSMRKQLIAQWVEDGESLHSFAEDVYMGEESEEAVKRIENSLDEIFVGYTGNNLMDLEFTGDSNATKGDFDDVVGIFESFAQEVNRIKEENSDYFEGKIEDNELYRFLIPVIESIAVGVSSFSSTAKIELDRLGDNYVERMEGAKQRVEEAKKEKTPVDFDLDLFDFEDDFANNSVGASVAVGNMSSALSNSIIENENKSNSHIQRVGEKLMKDFAPTRTDRKRIEEIIEYANADNLENDLRNFGSNGCRRSNQITNGYLGARNKQEIAYKKQISFLNDKYTKLLQNLYKQIEKELEEARKSLEKRYIKRTISQMLGINLYQESVNRANQVYNQRKLTLQEQYSQEKNQADNYYKQRLYELEQKKNTLFSEGVVGKCSQLYNERNLLADRVKKNEVNIKTLIQKKLRDILKECNEPCLKFTKIYQDVYLAIKPSVVGFSCEALGHRITINEKKKSWINANLSLQEVSNVNIDGILHMKTPIHEYLHYLSNGLDGTSGVKNMAQIGRLSQNAGALMRDAMTGFNEGITEMFAQDYLRDELRTNFDFKNVNEILDKSREIVKQKSYEPQVDVVRSICKVLGSSADVKEAYIKHDFSIIEKSIDSKLHQNGRTVDWNQIKQDMAEIQKCYTDKNPTTRRQSHTRMIKLRDKIIKELEG